MKCLMQELGVATQCGKCASFARQILETTNLQDEATAGAAVVIHRT